MIVLRRRKSFVAKVLILVTFCLHRDDLLIDSFSIPTASSRHAVQLQQPSSFLGNTVRFIAPSRQNQQQKRHSTELKMQFMDTGGFLGVGAPEVAVIVAVGYFLLGPTELFKLVKEIGKAFQGFRSFLTETSSAWEETMEQQLQLDEIRKAQQELTDAFSMRPTYGSGSFFEDDSATARLVNSVEEKEKVEEVGPVALAAMAGTNPKKKKRFRRRKKKIAPVEEITTGDVPQELNIYEGAQPVDSLLPSQNNYKDDAMDEDTLLRAQRMERLERASAEAASEPWAEAATGPSTPDWMADGYSDDVLGAGSGSPMAAAEMARLEMEELRGSAAMEEDDNSAIAAAEQNRFAQQLSGSWNEQVLANEADLEPMANIMQQLALLDQEKEAANQRLEEEFRRRTTLEEEYYNQKRELLQAAAAEMQKEQATQKQEQ